MTRALRLCVLTLGCGGHLPVDAQGRGRRAPGTIVRADRGALGEDQFRVVAADLSGFLRWLRCDSEGE